MDNITHLGLDVHKDTIAVPVLRPGDLSVDQRVIANTPEALRKLVARCGDPASLLACYEAGPTGYQPTGFSPRWGQGATSLPRRSPRDESVSG